MKMWMLAAIVFLCAGLVPQLEVLGPGNFVYAGPVREKMPDVSRAALVLEKDLDCAGAPYTWKLYVTHGGVVTEANGDVGLMFVRGAKKPFLAVLWSPPDYSTVARLLMDLDLNGYADIVGKPGDEAFGFNQCSAYMYYLSNKRP